MRRIFAAWLSAALLLGASSALAGDKTIYPEGSDPVAKKVNGRWVPVDEDSELTEDKSENALELLQMVRDGKADLQLDVTDWEPPLPTTVAQALYALRYDQNAKNVKFDGANVIDFGLYKPTTVEQALHALGKKEIPSSKVLLAGINVVHYGLDAPRTAEEALAVLARRIYELEARVAILEAP